MRLQLTCALLHAFHPLLADEQRVRAQALRLDHPGHLCLDDPRSFWGPIFVQAWTQRINQLSFQTVDGHLHQWFLLGRHGGADRPIPEDAWLDWELSQWRHTEWDKAVAVRWHGRTWDIPMHSGVLMPAGMGMSYSGPQASTTHQRLHQTTGLLGPLWAAMDAHALAQQLHDAIPAPPASEGRARL